MAQNLYVGKTTPAASVTVYWAGTTVKPTINVSDGGSAASNPITAAADGSYAFWADDGHYKIVNGSVAGDITSLRLRQAGPEVLPHASEIAVSPFRSSTATNLETLLENMQSNPTIPGVFTITNTTIGAAAGTGSFVTAGGLYVAKTSYFAGELNQVTANGGEWVRGSASELLTISTSGTTTDTTANLLPANSIIEAVVARVTTTITTATDWKLGDPTSATRFAAANSTMTAGATSIGILHWGGAVSTDALGPHQPAAAKVRVTTTGTPGAGAIRITVFYRTFVAPTS